MLDKWNTLRLNFINRDDTKQINVATRQGQGNLLLRDAHINHLPPQSLLEMEVTSSLKSVLKEDPDIVEESWLEIDTNAKRIDVAITVRQKHLEGVVVARVRLASHKNISDRNVDLEYIIEHQDDHALVERFRDTRECTVHPHLNLHDMIHM